MLKRLVVTIVVALFVTAVVPAHARAQARDGRLMVTVADPAGAVVIGATVTVTGLDDTNKALTIAPVKTLDKGIATFDGVTLGRYSIQAEFPGFQIGVLKDIRVRTGDNKHVVVLPLKKLEDSVTVGRDKQEAAADRAAAFGTAMTREQIEALSDDPDEMRRQLLEIAGPDAVIRVDSFEGQQLPPKAMIKSIHIMRDQFAAEMHGAGGHFVDIITQPGIGPLRANGRFGFYDSSLDGRNPLVAKNGPAQSRNYGMNLSGSLIKNRSSFNLNFGGNNSYSTPLLYAATPTGTRSENLNLRTPNDGFNVNGSFDYAVTKDQTLRIGYGQNRNSSRNNGIGAFDLIERAFEGEGANYNVRVQEAGPLGRRFFINTRFGLNWSDSSSRSATEAPTIVVTDAFTSGGAQRAGGRHTRSFTFNSDLDYVRGIHSWRAGVQIEGLRFRSNDGTNYLGTYTFESLTAYEAGTPRSYTRRIGDPSYAYWNVQSGVYLQDDIRLRKNLTFSAGARVEAQTHVRDYNNVSPRFGLTWSPFKAGRTTLRASWGIFHDWLSTATYGQTVQLDGTQLQEINLINPAYPDPGALGGSLPTNRYLLDSDIVMPRTTRVSAGWSQTITKKLSMGMTYNVQRGTGLLVGENLNAPIAGVRPDPAFANVIRAVPDARFRSQNLSTYSSLNIFEGSGGSAAQKLFDLKRNLGVYFNYSLSKSENDSDGAFIVPASGSLAGEWGPASGDVRHRVSLSANSSMLKNFNMSLEASWNSAPPITIRTGLDDNGDLIFNDRPAGAGRNGARTISRWGSSVYFSYSLGLGKKTIAMPPGIMIMGPGMEVRGMAPQAQPRYRLAIAVSIDNLTNHATYTGFSGVMTSPFFLKPTSASGVRRVNLSMNLGF